MNIGSTIKDLRKKKGIKQGVFAETIGISGTSLSQIENGNTTPKKQTLEKICNELNVTTELIYLLSIREEDIPEANKDKYQATFAGIRNLMIDVFSEDDKKALV